MRVATKWARTLDAAEIEVVGLVDPQPMAALLHQLEVAVLGELHLERALEYFAMDEKLAARANCEAQSTDGR